MAALRALCCNTTTSAAIVAFFTPGRNGIHIYASASLTNWRYDLDKGPSPRGNWAPGLDPGAEPLAGAWCLWVANPGAVAARAGKQQCVQRVSSWAAYAIQPTTVCVGGNPTAAAVPQSYPLRVSVAPAHRAVGFSAPLFPSIHISVGCHPQRRLAGARHRRHS